MKLILGSIVGIFIVILIGTSLYQPIMEKVNNAMAIQNTKGYYSTMIGLVPGLFAIVVMISVIMLTYNALSSVGLMGGDSSELKADYAEVIEKDPNHKQTYLEYVKERRAVEKLIRS